MILATKITLLINKINKFSKKSKVKMRKTYIKAIVRKI